METFAAAAPAVESPLWRGVQAHSFASSCRGNCSSAVNKLFLNKRPSSRHHANLRLAFSAFSDRTRLLAREAAGGYLRSTFASSTGSSRPYRISTQAPRRQFSTRGLPACAAQTSGNSFSGTPEDEETKALQSRSSDEAFLEKGVVLSLDSAQETKSEDSLSLETFEAREPERRPLILAQTFLVLSEHSKKARAFGAQKSPRTEYLEDLDEDTYQLPPGYESEGEASWEDSGSDQVAKLPAWLESLFALSWNWGPEEEVEAAAGTGVPVPEAGFCVLVTSKTMANADAVISGTEHEVMLQGFNWESHKYRNPSWWVHLAGLIPELESLGITSVWLPPPSRSLAPQGYIPQDLYCLDSEYGSEQELRALLMQLKESRIRAVADLVVNHRAGSTQDDQGRWTRYHGLRPQWDEYAVTSDTGGKGAPSTGTVFEGIANIDHTQDFVRKDLKDWMKWLRHDVGFSCFRFDFAKGYSPEFAKEYLEAGEPNFAIGEFWDTCNYVGPNHMLDYDQDSHRQRIVDWIDGTGGQSAAFDFTTKAILQEAVRGREWNRLNDNRGKAPGLLGFWPSRSVTFVDNHDTGSTQAHWPFPGQFVLQGYAYILTHPGIPSVFYDHLFDWGDSVKEGIQQLLECRKRGGVVCNSPMEILKADEESYVARVGDNLIVQLGAWDWNPKSDSGKPFELACKGTESCPYAVWIRDG